MEKGLSQTDLAEKLGVNPNNIGRYERGESNPNAKFLKALAECLGVSVDYLYDGLEEDAAIANLGDKELLELFAKVEKLSEKDKNLIKEFLGAFVKNREAATLLAS
jgi:transcriptional regulator with XRE-family HTH domain